MDNERVAYCLHLVGIWTYSVELFREKYRVDFGDPEVIILFRR